MSWKEFCILRQSRSYADAAEHSECPQSSKTTDMDADFDLLNHLGGIDSIMCVEKSFLSSVGEVGYTPLLAL